MARPPVRELVRVPIVHHEVELGTLGKSIRKLYRRRFGEGGWRKRVESVAALWQTIRSEIDGLGLDYTGVRLYQDGLPHCGREADIVRDLATGGSENHRLLLELMSKGARLVGTESVGLLVREYQLARATMEELQTAGQRPEGRRRQERSQAVLVERDRYIARRVAETLRPGETGLLFLGLLHSVEEYLPEDVRVRALLDPSQEQGCGAPCAPSRGPRR